MSKTDKDMRMQPEPYMKVKAPTEEQYHSCIKCGLCVPGCPTYKVTLSETESPRGRVMLARNVLEGKLKPGDNFQDQMDRCMDCLACNKICPVGIKPADLALDMRYASEQIKPTWWKSIVFGGLLKTPTRLEFASLPVRLYQSLGIRWLAHKLKIFSLLPAKLRDLEAQLPKIPVQPLRLRVPVTMLPENEHKHTVGFFLGCGQSILHSRSSEATLTVLRHNGCKIITPRETKCCGMPARGYGRMDEALTMARFNIELYEKLECDLIVTDCATCGSMLKEYAGFFKDDPVWADRAALFSRKVRDVSEFLSSIPLKSPEVAIKKTVTVHDPCHMVRAQNIRNQPREILELINGLEIVEMKGADECCGSAGSQLITHYTNSSSILDRKIASILETDADAVASGCPACRMQITTGLKRSGVNIDVVHPVELLANAYEENRKGAKNAN